MNRRMAKSARYMTADHHFGDPEAWNEHAVPIDAHGFLRYLSTCLGKNYESVTEGIVLVLTIVAWEYALDWAAWRYPSLRPYLKPPALTLVGKPDC
jgi:hypothetical protein